MSRRLNSLAAAGVLGLGSFAGCGSGGEKVPSTNEIAANLATDVALGHMIAYSAGAIATVVDDGERLSVVNPIIITSDEGDKDTLYVAARTSGSDAGEGSVATVWTVGQDGVSHIKVDQPVSPADSRKLVGEFPNADVRINYEELRRMEGLSTYPGVPREQATNFFVASEIPQGKEANAMRIGWLAAVDAINEN